MEEDIEKITVIVPVFNRAGLVERALESIRVQDVRPLRMIIVDNDSTDNSAEVCREWARKHSDEAGLTIDVIEEKRPGAAQARQTGFEAARSEWVYFFDSDDEMRYGILSAALAEADDADIVYWPLIQLDFKEQWSRKPFSKKNQFRRHLYNGLLSTQAYIVRSDFLRGVGGWNPEAKVWNDWELGVRLLLGDPVIKAVEKTGATIYPQAESITGLDFHSKHGEWEKTLEMVERRLKALQGERIFNRWQLSRTAMLEMVAYRRAILAAHYAREGHGADGDRLLKEAIEKSELTPTRQRLLKLIYHYTRLGGRAAYLVWH